MQLSNRGVAIMGRSRRLSHTPDPNSPTFPTEIPYATELEEVCSALGLSLSELYPRPISTLTVGPHLLNSLRLQHSEELRKAKVEIVRRELTKRLQGPRPLTGLREIRPISGVELWKNRLEKATERAETERRVRGNQSKLKAREQEVTEERTKADLQRHQKRLNDRQTLREELRAKAALNQSHRSAILQRSRKARELEEKQAFLSLSPRPQPRTSPSPPLPTTVVRSNPASEDQIPTQLANIQLRLSRGFQRATAAKQAKSQSVRLKTAQKRLGIDSEEGQKRQRDVLKSLLQSSQRHLRNKETRMAASVVKIRQSGGKVRTNLAESQDVEAKVREKEKEHEEYVRKLQEIRENERILKAESKKMKLEELENAKKRLHSANLARKDQILDHFRHSEAQIREIHSAKQRLESLRQHAEQFFQVNPS